MFQVLGIPRALSEINRLKKKIPDEADNIVQETAMRIESGMVHKIRMGIPPSLSVSHLKWKLKHGYSATPLILTGALLRNIYSKRLGFGLAEVGVRPPSDEYAIVHEFGSISQNIPARPFFYPTINEEIPIMESKLVGVLK